MKQRGHTETATTTQHMRRRQNILHLSSMFLKGYRFFGGQIVLQGFGVFDTILNFHNVEASKFLSA